MINNEDFSKRLQVVMDYYGENASSFAEKIGVQRSSISHILSGRNKPSLEFVLKVLSSFSEVELYWLMNGKGKFPKSDSEQVTESSSASKEITKGLFSVNENETTDTIQNSDVSNITPQNNSVDKKIERIVIFYSDGSFSNFKN